MMNLNRKLVLLAFALTVAVATAGQSFAALSLTDVQAYDSLNALLGSATAAVGPISGNDNGLDSSTMNSLFSSSPFTGTETWTNLGKSDGAGSGPFTSNPQSTTGTLTFDTPIAMGQAFAISLKAADGYAVYAFAGFSSPVSYVTFNTQALGTNPSGAPKFDLSHASLLVGRIPDGQVPEPATLVVWSFLGMVGAAVAWRKRSV
jgi:hypothetical protein